MKTTSPFNVAIILMATIFAVGCSTAKISSSDDTGIKTMKPLPGKALLYIVRPSSLGFAVGFTVTCDGKLLGTTKGKRFLYAFLDSGLHTIVSHAENVATIYLQANPGATYFIEQKPTWGIGKARNELLRLDENTGRKKLGSCRLSGNCAACSLALH